MPREKVSLWSCMISTHIAPYSWFSHSFHQLTLPRSLNSRASRHLQISPKPLTFTHSSYSSGVPEVKMVNWHAVRPRNDFIILLIVLSDTAQEGLSVCITNHLLGHNVETEALHYLALHGCPLSCVRSALSLLVEGKIVWYTVHPSMLWASTRSFTACRADLYTVYIHQRRRSTWGYLLLHFLHVFSISSQIFPGPKFHFSPPHPSG